MVPLVNFVFTRMNRMRGMTMFELDLFTRQLSQSLLFISFSDLRVRIADPSTEFVRRLSHINKLILKLTVEYSVTRDRASEYEI